MKALIIAAGRGSRLQSVSELKPLTELHGRPLIGHVIDNAAKAGVSDICIVTGFRAEQLQRETTSLYQGRDITLDFIHNPRWEEGNGLSVLAAAARLSRRFLLLMSDHLLSSSIPRQLIAEPTPNQELLLAVDRRIRDNPLVDLSDVTRVCTELGRIVAIGKQLSHYDAFDTGAFSCPPALFQALRESLATGDQSLSGGITRLARQGLARSLDIGETDWIDVDNESMLNLAKSLFDSAT